MSIGARIFVALIFFVLGASFIATTAVLYDEFKHVQWFSLAVFYSHLFVFFPIFGLLALWAFYIPASAFTDLYWFHVPYGKLRFIVGLILVAAASYFIAQLLLSSSERSIWEVTPAVLERDQGEPANCDPRVGQCRRLPILQALETVRDVSKGRTGLSLFARDCKPDPLVEKPPVLAERRFCFVTNTLPPEPQSYRTAEECCQAQADFVSFLSEAHADQDQQSFTGFVHSVLLPLKVFFLLTLLIVGVLLALRRRSVDEYYAPYSAHIERGVLIGAFAMLFWPIMNHAFLQSASVLYGTSGGSIFRILGPGFSIAFGAWGLLLLFFFYRRYEKSLEAVGKIAGVVASGIAILKYDTIVDHFVRFAGSGASIVTVGVLSLIAFILLVQLLRRRRKRTEQDEGSGARAAAATAASAAAAFAAGVHKGSDTESIVDVFKDGGPGGTG